MARKFIPLVLAASLAVTGMTAAPAKAGDRDVATALGALAGIAVLGAVIHDAQKDRRHAESRRHVQPNYYVPPGQYWGHKYRKHHKRHNHVASRAYRHGYYDHRRVVRDHRAERRVYDSQYGYSARPHRHRR
jgi:hypothetical protein